MTRYVMYVDTKEIIAAIQRSGVKIDPMVAPKQMNDGTVTRMSIKVADWVPRMVKSWRDSGYAEAMPLEDFLRKAAGRIPVP